MYLPRKGSIVMDTGVCVCALCIFLLLAVLLPDHAGASDATADAAWVRHPWWVIGAGFFFFMEALLIVFLLLNIRQRKKVEQGLRESEIRYRKKNETELHSYRRNLEQIVQERTAELEAEIDRRQEAQEALSVSEAHLKRAQELAILGSWYLDIRSNELFWSDFVYEIFGLSAGTSLSYEDFLNTIHPDDREYVKKSWDSAMRKQPYDIEHRIVVNGGIKWVRERAEVDFSDDGTPVRGIGIVQDITRRKQAEEEHYKLTRSLAHVSRVATIGELTAALAHEINQPLAAILANAQAARHLIDRDAPDIQELRDTLDDIISDDKRAREVIRRVRSLIRKESPTQEEADINEIVQESARIIGQDSASKGIPVRIDLQADLPRVTADRIQIGQVVINLLVNALEAAADSDGGPHTVIVQSMTDSEGNVAVSVKDTGKGIDESSLPLLFEPFYTTKTQGLGLGLSISRSIIEAHGGKLTAVSNPGLGAEFTFSLPGKSQGETM